MKENKITITIDKPIEEVFEFSTNPQNTHLWATSIEEEVAEEYPPKINTIYKNRGQNYDWESYKVAEFEKNKLFTLTDSDKNYSVRYTYKKIASDKTEMEYYEWVKTGELKNPYTRNILENLKSILENN